MTISKEDKKLLENGIIIPVPYDYDSEGVYIDEEELREKFENRLEELMEIEICKCGFCGEPLEEDSRYCCGDCYRADNAEGV